MSSAASAAPTSATSAAKPSRTPSTGCAGSATAACTARTRRTWNEFPEPLREGSSVAAGAREAPPQPRPRRGHGLGGGGGGDGRVRRRGGAAGPNLRVHGEQGRDDLLAPPLLPRVPCYPVAIFPSQPSYTESNWESRASLCLP